MLTRLFFRGARVLHVSSGLRNPVANDVGDRPTLGSDSGSRNWAVGRKSGHLVRQLGLGLRRSRNKTGRCGVSGEMGGRVWGYFVAQREQAPSPRSEASYAFFGRCSSCRACEAAFGCAAVVNQATYSFRRAGFAGIARTSSSDAASRCSAAATGSELFSGWIICRDQYPAC